MSFAEQPVLSFVDFRREERRAALIGVEPLHQVPVRSPDLRLTGAGRKADPAQAGDVLARSPITKVDEIRTPLLVVQGANDARVPKVESDVIVESLSARGVPVGYLVADDEGHGFQNPENVITMWRAIERHFAEHLGGRSHHAPQSEGNTP